MYTVQGDNYFLSRYPFLMLVLFFGVLLFINRKRGMKKAPFFICAATAILLDWAIFEELWAASDPSRREMRCILSAIGYTLRPMFACMMCFVLEPKRKRRLIYSIPLIFNGIISFLSIFNGWVFSYNDNYNFIRGPLGTVPFIVPGLYFALFGYLLYRYCNSGHRQNMAVIIVAYLGMLVSIGLDVFLDGTTIPICAIVCILFIYIHMSFGEAQQDDLTGLANRAAFFADLEYRPDCIVGIAMLDMNDLKGINDKKGHLYGDQALRQIGRALLRNSSLHATPYRIGGDEFSIIFRRIPQEKAAGIVTNVRAELQEKGISVAAGYSYRTGADKAGLTLLRTQADDKMYEDKKAYHDQPEHDRRKGKMPHPAG